MFVISNPRRFRGEVRLKAVGIAPTINATDYKDPPLKVDAYERDNELYNTGQPTGTRREISCEGGGTRLAWEQRTSGCRKL